MPWAAAEIRAFATVLIGLLLTAPVDAEPPKPLFSDPTAASGVDFVHRHHGTGEKYMPENMGPGLAILDVDGDGRLDLFFVQGAPVNPKAPSSGEEAADAGHRLFRQKADGTFEDVSERAGVRVPGVGMGACHGDVDGDGDPDLYVTQFGPDLLLLNRGDGTFREAAAEVGLGGSSWSTGCAFFDPDLDGDLDLFVSSYVDFSLENHKFCGNAGRKLRSYCHPDVYAALPDALFLNQGLRDGTVRFRKAGPESGVRPSPDAKGLGVLATDFNDDGRPDLFVANDSTMNHLYLGDGRGGFEESALLSGVGFNRSGAAEAGMGVAYGDLDGDGRGELFVTHLDQETNTLYRPLGDGLFADATDASGLGPPSLPWVGFGTAFLDYDLDGDLDVAVVNGHILDNIRLFSPDRQHRQPAQLFENEGGRFRELSGALEGTEALVGRGLLAADLDDDGDPDLVLTQNDGPARILRNDAPAGRFVKIRLGSAGARIEVKTGEKTPHEKTLVRHALGASGYLSQGPPEVIVGLGQAPRADAITVSWPSGRVSKIGPTAAGSVLQVSEPAEDQRDETSGRSEPSKKNG